VQTRRNTYAFCTAECRAAAFEQANQKKAAAACAETPAKTKVKKRPRAIAVLNQKGGTGKTTTAVSIASGLASAGESVLLVDLDPQGSIGVSLGVHSPRSVYHVLNTGLRIDAAVVPLRDNLDVVTADQSLAAAEIQLARANENERLFRLESALAELSDYDYVLFDCAPALSILNYNALIYAGEVLIPVSCDYLSLIGVKQVLQTMRRLSEQTGRKIVVSGVVPTFLDVRSGACTNAYQQLHKTFGMRMTPPVRVNVKLAEAPRRKRTIFEHAPQSNGAADYAKVVQWLRNQSAPKYAAMASTAAQQNESISATGEQKG